MSIWRKIGSSAGSGAFGLFCGAWAFLLAVGVAMSIGPDRECDGICLDRLPRSLVVGAIVGTLVALLAGAAAWRSLRKRRWQHRDW